MKKKKKELGEIGLARLTQLTGRLARLTQLHPPHLSLQVFDEECGCVFHAGFKEVADAVVQDLEAFLEPGVEIKVAGHSLGGAAAVIVAAKLKLRGYNVGKVQGRVRACVYTHTFFFCSFVHSKRSSRV